MKNVSTDKTLRAEVSLIFKGRVAETAWCEFGSADEVGRSMVDAYLPFGECDYTVRPVTVAPIVPLSPRPKKRRFDTGIRGVGIRGAVSDGSKQPQLTWGEGNVHRKRRNQRVRKPRPTGKVVHHFEVVN